MLITVKWDVTVPEMSRYLFFEMNYVTSPIRYKQAMGLLLQHSLHDICTSTHLANILASVELHTTTWSCKGSV